MSLRLGSAYSAARSACTCCSDLEEDDVSDEACGGAAARQLRRNDGGGLQLVPTACSGTSCSSNSSAAPVGSSAARELGVALPDIQFSAAHFVAFRGFRERLHGHNYSVSIRLGSEQLGADGYVNRHQVSAYVVAVPHERPPFYEACTMEVPGFNEGQTRCCNKKVVDGRCSGGHSCPQPAVRYNLFLKVADAFSSVCCGAFGDQAEQLAGIPAARLAQLYGNMQCGDIEAGRAYEAAFRKMISGPWSLSLKCRKEAWEGRERTKISVESCSSVDLVKDAYAMADAVRQAIGAPRSV
eukprot:TRINITY_DN5047_c0_g1_i1.p1 TRINITY_DN5047_c0_g1~~TRINITY_DN5047_c0_g1_i1.p1  ORF type:complete len:297 (-),score=56.80 TRINITY_DN5047_c0_g1_i1:23-913(-)